ncbi:MAG: hypothetical protein IPN01_12740 [Deltaproteobacteria bacterium]|nr:hypothetical protein [Deltaproteobacteria bacterium]
MLSAEGPLDRWEVVTAWARVSGGRRLGGALALGVLAAGVWWLGAPGEVVSVTKRVELPEEWEVVAPEVGRRGARGARRTRASATGPLRPTLANIPGGTFLMGRGPHLGGRAQGLRG